MKHKRIHATLLSGLFATGTYMNYADTLRGLTVRLERERTFQQLVAEIPGKYGIPREVVETVLEKESGGLPLKRFEPSQMSRASRITKDPEQQREYASSHGAFQIMAWHLKLKPDGGQQNLGDWYDLYKPQVQVEQFARIWLDCFSRQRGTKWERYSGSALCYNGSDKYATDFMGRLARKAIEKL